MINVGIVDDHAIVRTGLRQFLSEQVDIRVAGEAATAREAIDLVRNSPALNVLLMDLSMPGQSGMEAIRVIQATAPALGILILSGYPEEHYAINVLAAGARGYLSKDCDPVEILNAIHTVALGRRHLSASVAQLLAQQLKQKSGAAAHDQLSSREFQVFLQLAKGARGSGIAAALSLSVKTVSTYRTRLLEKMGLESNSDLTYYAMKHGLID
jgi:DNA-binding NarL/FixJ family response regulator